jgi:UDP-N-acetylmuramate--alanine ligase
MGEALTAADVAVVTDVYRARETPVAGITGRLVADAATARGVPVVYEPVRSKLTERVFGLVQPGDVVLTLGAGDVTLVGPEILRRLAAR